MATWKQFKPGDHVIMISNDFDGKAQIAGVISAVFADHAIMTADGMNLWIDDDTADMFKRGDL